MSTAALVLGAMIALLRPGSDAERSRLHLVAEAISAQSHLSPLWPDDEGELATGLALVAIGIHESKFSERVLRCKPRGRYLGAYQILPGANTRPHKDAEVCASDDLQARIALRLLRRSRERCKSCPPAFLFRAHASGNGNVRSREARDIIELWEKAARQAGLQVFPHATTPPRRTPDRR